MSSEKRMSKQSVDEFLEEKIVLEEDFKLLEFSDAYSDVSVEYCVDCDQETEQAFGVKVVMESHKKYSSGPQRFTYCFECENEFYQDMTRQGDKKIFDD